MNKTAFLLAGLLAATSLAPALKAETDPKDVLPAPPGTDAVLMYTKDVSGDKTYVDGKKVTGFNLASQVTVLRYVHFSSVGPFTYQANLLLPYGNLHADGTALGNGQFQSSGLGDIMANVTIYLVNDYKKRNWAGVGCFVGAPTGEYDTKAAVNFGDKRWFVKPQMLAGTGFGKCLAEVGADFTIYKDRDAGATTLTSKKDPLTNVWASCTYDVNKALFLAGTLSMNKGGGTKVQGVSQNDKTDATTAMFSTGLMVTPQFQIVVQYRHDIANSWGPATSQMNTRLAYFF